MKKVSLLISVFCFFTSCILFNKGHLANEECRPKKGKFQMLKVPFKETDKLEYDHIYAGATITSFGFGFYPDGRLIFIGSDDGFTLKGKDVLGKNWDNAGSIGYWRVEENKIKVEFFVCNEGGYYMEKQGEIKHDTIIFYQNVFLPFKKEIREEKYVLSPMPFK